MSQTVATLSGRSQIVTSGFPQLFGVAKVYVSDPTAAGLLNGTATLTGVVDLVRPRTDRRQLVAPFRVTVGSTVLPPWQVLPGLYLEEGENGTVFGFAMPLHSSSSPPGGFVERLGSPISWLGPPAGKAAISIDAILLSATGPRTIRLLTDGIFDNSDSSVSPGGDVRSFVGLDAKARYDQQLVTITFPPGHGQQRGVVARRILEAIGVSPSKIAIGATGRMYKALQAVDRPGVALAEELLRTDLLELYRDRAGVWRTRRMGFDAEARTEFVFRSKDLLFGIGSLGESSTSDGPTSVTLTGSAQVLRDEHGNRTVDQVIESYAIYSPRVAAKKQAVGGTLSASGYTAEPATLRLVTRVERRTEYEGDTVVSTRVKTYAWHNLRRARYTLDTSGAINGYKVGWIYEGTAVTDDSNELYYWPTEHFGLVSDVLTRHVFDSRSFLVQTVVDSDGMLQRRKALKTRSAPSSTWESQNFVASLMVLGNGEGVVDELEMMTTANGLVPGQTPKSRETTTFEVTDDGFIQREKTVPEGWTHRPGTSALYSGGEESADAQDTFVPQGGEEVIYAANSEGSHSETRIRTDITGSIVTIEDTSGVQGHLPSATRKEGLLPAGSTYDDDAEAEFAAAASRYESQQIKVRVSADALLAVREAAESKGSSEWVENLAELEALAVHEIREGCKLSVQFALPFNPLVRRSQRVRLIVEHLGWNYDVFVRSARHQQDERMTWTQVRGDVYLV